jgi:integrase
MRGEKPTIKKLCWCKDKVTGRAYPEGACPKLASKSHGSYWFRLEAPPVDGVKRRQPRYGPYPTLHEARAGMVKESKRLEAGGSLLDKDLLYRDFLDMWLEQKKHLKSLDTYEEIVRLYAKPGLGHLKLVDLRPAHFNELVSEMRKINRKKEEKESEMMVRLMNARANYSRKPGKEVRKYSTRIISLSRVHKVIAVLRSSMTYAVQLEALDKNPAEKLPIPKVRKKKPLLWTDGRVAKWRITGKKPAKVMVWTPQQAGQFLDRIEGHRLYSLLHLVMLTGLRRSEVLGLSWFEVDLNGGWMMIRDAITAPEPEEELDEWDDAELDRLGTKSEAGERYVSLSGDSIAVLKAWKRFQNTERLKAGKDWEDTGLVFTKSNGKPLHPDTLAKAFLRLIKQHDFPPVTFHGLRHGAATAQLAAGTAPKVISAGLGHSRTSFTMDTYVHVTPDVQKEAAEAAAAIVPRSKRNRESTG